MQPFAAGGPDGVRRVRTEVQEKPLNAEGWWRRGEGGVAADQVCCHLTKYGCHGAHTAIVDIFPALLCAEA